MHFKALYTYFNAIETYKYNNAHSLIMGYKVVFDRKNCTGVAACAIVAEKFWKMAEDDRAELVGSRNTGDDVWVLEIKEDALKLHKEAARHCPVKVIKIIDESGKEVHLERV